jgi:hypothetical protein
MANFAVVNGYSTRNTLRRISSKDMKHGGLALAGQVIFAGCMVGIDATAGTIRKGGGVIATFTGGMLGRSRVTKNPAVATDTIEWDEGIFCWQNVGGITIASRGKTCFADDDQSVSLTNTNVTAGTIEDVDSFGVWVYMGSDTRVP